MVDSSESRLAGIRWLRLAGSRHDVFRRLGELAADEVHAAMESMPERRDLRAWATTLTGRATVARLREAATSSHPEVLAELAALAEGADVDAEELLLANLRGDVGTQDGTGCTDLAVRGVHNLVAHNEDGAPALDGTFMFVTLRVDDEPAVTAQWYPGFTPANAHVVTEAGLTWGINHIQVVHPADAPGRHFLARRLQGVSGLDEALSVLGRTPTAGGFTYTIGECGSRRVAVVETAAGKVDVHDVVKGSVEWHTNHLRRLPKSLDTAASSDNEGAGTGSLGQREESERRASWLRSHVTGVDGGLATADWMTSVLAENTLPDGVRREALDGDPLMTLMTTVVDLDDETVTLRGARGDIEHLSIEEYLWA